MADVLRDRIGKAAFAFRGYNITNLGRSDELLQHPAYGSIVRRYLEEASQIYADVLHKPADLVERVRARRDTDLQSYGEAIALIVAMELAQIELLREFHGIDYTRARLAFGYSLGELAALSCAGVISMAEVLTPPLAMSSDCAALAEGVTLGVVFSRGPALKLDDIYRLCLRINQAGRGVIGVSTVLSPNSVLVLGQDDTVQRFGEMMHETLHPRVHLRINSNRWPPLHTPIMWQRCIPDRAVNLMHTMAGGLTAPCPPIVSLVTGKASYNDYNMRELMHRWVDHPQRLWEAVYETLAAGVELVFHVGPDPNIVPATFKRISDNVRLQIAGRSLGSWGLRAVSGMVRRQWLSAVLPSRTALLRAPQVQHIVVEDWLLDQPIN